MVAVQIQSGAGRGFDATNVRFLFDIENDEPVGDPTVQGDFVGVNLSDGARLGLGGEFGPLADALKSGDLDQLFFVLPFIRVDTLARLEPNGDQVVAAGLGLSGTDLLPFFDSQDLDAGYVFFLRGNDTFIGGAGNDSLSGFAGNDIVLGMDGNDSVLGSNGDDELNGNKGVDVVDGGPDRDFARGGQESDLVIGGDGDDWHLNGNNANDTVQGGNGADAIFGGKEDDLLMGQDGNDFLSGDLGNDVVVGGLNADVFAFDDGSGLDFVFDFRPDEGDRIGIRQDVNGVPLRTGTDVISRALQAEEGTVLDLGSDNFVLLDFFQRADLRAEHFVIF